MPLFQIQDNDRPMYVIANNWEQAVDAWRKYLELTKEEHGTTEFWHPRGVSYIAPDDELIICYLSEFTPSDTQQGEPGVSLADGVWEPAKGTFETKDPSCKDPWHTAQRRETNSCPTCGFEPEIYKRLRESGAWEKSGINDPPTCGGAAPPNDPPINSAIKCPNCDSMSYYTDGHHGLTCSVCQYVAPPLK